ncbi:hypothetical protein [Halorubrum aethiopicum]|uniref:hypothetical protein n=1 Tax=Halorubrum aethiopicum TaxID=1758255 RepID=UPI000830160F|nr:hypothetical protein [Halorubrum aethiopicum]
MSTHTDSPGGTDMLALREALTSNGIEIVDLRLTQGDPHLVYEQPGEPDLDADGDTHLQQVVTIALVFAGHARAVDRLATVTAVEPDSHELTGRLYVNRRVVDEYRQDDISKQEYATEVASTFRSRDIC